MASTVGLFFIPMLYVVIQGGVYLMTGKRNAIQGTPPTGLEPEAVVATGAHS